MFSPNLQSFSAISLNRDIKLERWDIFSLSLVPLTLEFIIVDVLLIAIRILLSRGSKLDGKLGT